MRVVRFILAFLLLLAPFIADAANQGDHALASDYKDGHFHTTVMYDVDASYADLQAVLDEIYTGMQTQPTKNLDWLWKGLGKSKGDFDDMKMKEKGVYFDHNTSEYTLNLEVGMAGQKPAVYEVEGNLSRQTGKSKHVVGLAVTKKIKILNDANFVITAVPYSWNHSRVYVHSSIAFGWLFNMLITKEKYKSVLQWRIDGMGQNIKKRAENRK